MASKRRKQKNTKPDTPATPELRKKADPKPPKPALSRRRKWLFRLTVLVLAPLLFFSVLEIGLRLGGYGFPTGFYLASDESDTYMTNVKFAWRFFPPALARKPIPGFLSAKSPETVRIFVLGSSAAQGVPNPAFSFGRILEVMLQKRYPGVKFEVVNAAMTAINSHVVREIACDCAGHQPDLFIVYTGNNEVVGPYGPGTVFQQWSPSLRLIRANAWLKTTRTGQLLGDAMDCLRPRNNTPRLWRGMEMFLNNPVACDDSRLVSVYENFQRNLQDICRVGRDAGAAVILSTVGVNLKDCPPFASQHRSGVSTEELAQWKALYTAGIELESNKQWAEALKKYAAAAKLDDRFAELRFRIGRCLAAENRLAEAREQFTAARDLDVLRFRADSKINAIIRETVAAQATAGVLLADGERSLAAGHTAPNGIPGEELFYEHVHLTFEGNYLLAKAVLDQVEAALPKLPSSRQQGPVLSRDQCMESLVMTPWDEYQMANQIVRMTSRPPFTNQLEHSQRHAATRELAKKLYGIASTNDALRAASKTYETALEKAPDDWELKLRFFQLATESGQPELVDARWRTVPKKLPRDPDLHIALGDALKSWENFEEAIQEYKTTLEIDPDNVTAHNNFGAALATRGRTDEAMAHYRRALEIDPDTGQAHNNLGFALASRGQIDEAIVHYRKALDFDPEYTLAHNNLGIALYSKGQSEEAIDQFQRALEIDPKNAMANFNLGIALANRGQIDAAIARYRKALESDPNSTMIHNNLGSALAVLGRMDEAIEHFKQAAKCDPRSELAFGNLGKALARRGRIDEAITYFRKALEIKPDFADARNGLNAALAERERGM